ncbi:hypothetical protein MMC18_008693 [Xylographa bjoerkii]|nr:hypothetical protein [Xylographa bjoerkii]
MGSSGFQVGRDMPDLTGYVAIVTGGKFPIFCSMIYLNAYIIPYVSGNSGIGNETALQLALRHACVYIASRSSARVEEAIAKMKESAKKVSDLDLHFLPLDLQDLESVKKAANQFMQRESRLDMLICNAGVRTMSEFVDHSHASSEADNTYFLQIMAVPFELTVDGYEKQWQTCYLGHHALFLSLLPVLQSTATASAVENRVRVVMVSSDAGILMGPKVLNYDDPNMTSAKGPLASWSVTTNLQAADPSFVGTFIRLLVKFAPTTMSIPDGARTTLFCATSAEAPRYSGQYFVPFGKVDSKAEKWINDKAAVDKLWNMSNKALEKAGIIETI